jgi:hypothetical protein
MDLLDQVNIFSYPCKYFVIDHRIYPTISINRVLVNNICVYLDKPRRLIRQANMDESDLEDDMSITDKLRRASSHSPANIPMIVVVSFNPDSKGLQKKQIEIQRGE